MTFNDTPETTWETLPFSPEEVAVVLRAASAAPSLYNSQPWRFSIVDHEIRIFADPDRRSPMADPDGRQQLIACGAALLNVRLTVQHLGFQPQVSLWPSGDESNHLATVRRGREQEIGAVDRKLYAQISRRHTNRERFGARPIFPAARQVLRYAASTESAWLRPIDTSPDQRAVVELLVRAIRAQRSDHQLGAEMARWLHTEAGSEGMPVAAWRGAEFPVPGLDDRAGGGVWEQIIARLVRAQTFFVLATPQDKPTCWLNAGQALQRALLSATQLDLAVSFFNQIVESPECRTELSTRLDLKAHPQMMLRVGYPAHQPPVTGRRPLDDILDDA